MTYMQLLNLRVFWDEAAGDPLFDAVVPITRDRPLVEVISEEVLQTKINLANYVDLETDITSVKSLSNKDYSHLLKFPASVLFQQLVDDSAFDLTVIIDKPAPSSSTTANRKEIKLAKTLATSKPDTLTLSIVHLDYSIDQIDHSVADATTRMLDHLSCSKPFETQEANNSESCRVLREKVEKSIMRFRRDQDQWTSLTSLLLKSLAFYRSLNPTSFGIPAKAETDGSSLEQMKKMEIKEKKLFPIMDLPRTKLGRPFLPQPPCDISIGSRFKKEESCISMMNVSHQYPWVGMAQEQLGVAKESSKLGLDVVVFDARLNDYTPTVTDFLKSFIQSYTPWEWERINNHKHPSWFGRGMSTRRRCDESALREFFLRWSMKEAYTKALGMGMHINFDEFETRLYGVDIDTDTDARSSGQEGGIWTSIMRQGDTEGNIQHQISVIGKVKRIKPPTSSEFWEFIFVPLLGNKGGHGSAHEITESQPFSDDSCYDACACICRGPLEKDALDNAKKNPVTIESLTLVDLIQLHGSNPL